MGNVVKYRAKNAKTSNTDEDRVPAKVWMNIGELKMVEDPETGELKEDFITYKTGIPMDTMPDVDGKGKKAQARNNLRDKTIARAMKLEPGETVILPGKICGLQIQLRRVKDDEIVDPQDNPFETSVDFG